MSIQTGCQFCSAMFFTTIEELHDFPSWLEFESDISKSLPWWARLFCTKGIERAASKILYRINSEECRRGHPGRIRVVTDPYRPATIDPFGE